MSLTSRMARRGELIRHLRGPAGAVGQRRLQRLAARELADAAPTGRRGRGQRQDERRPRMPSGQKPPAAAAGSSRAGPASSTARPLPAIASQGSRKALVFLLASANASKTARPRPRGQRPAQALDPQHGREDQGGGQQGQAVVVDRAGDEGGHGQQRPAAGDAGGHSAARPALRPPVQPQAVAAAVSPNKQRPPQPHQPGLGLDGQRQQADAGRRQVGRRRLIAHLAGRAQQEGIGGEAGGQRRWLQLAHQRPEVVAVEAGDDGLLQRQRAVVALQRPAQLAQQAGILVVPRLVRRLPQRRGQGKQAGVEQADEKDDG